ncbi:hypothetical protein ACQPYH_22915 [Kribbella sp. CA-245084]|uniref:hypothetical protein n=1 Tax=Kribbella sp. CA-245084 TaxID=3239940 RepID=UPI003D8B8E8C
MAQTDGMTVESLTEQLSTECSSSLRSTLSVELGTVLTLPDQNPHLPGAVGYQATTTLTWYPHDEDNPSDLQLLGSIAGQGTEVDSGVEFTVGHGNFIMVDMLQPDLFEALDERESDLSYLGSCLFAAHANDGYEIEAELDNLESTAILVNSVEVDPQWRGLRLGLLATGLVIQELGRSSSFAALHPMQPGLDDPHERSRSHRRLAGYWSQLGFRPWREEVLVLDLSTRTLDDNMSELLARY